MNELTPEEPDDYSEKFTEAMRDLKELFRPIVDAISEFSNRFVEAIVNCGKIEKIVRKLLNLQRFRIQHQHGKRIKEITLPKHRKRTNLLLTGNMLYN